MRPMRNLALALTAATLCAACTPIIEHHGQRLDPELLAAIRPGISSREEVARLLGSPSTFATFDERIWYYVTQKVEKPSFFQTRLVEQQVIAIQFDDRGIVRAIERRDLAQARPITPVADQTPTRGTELTLIQQLLGNIGRFNRPPGPYDSRL